MKMTGRLFAAGRRLAGLTVHELGAKAHISDDTIRCWERSSAASVSAKPALMNRAIDALALAGVIFTDDGVRRAQPPSVCARPQLGAASLNAASPKMISPGLDSRAACS